MNGSRLSGSLLVLVLLAPSALASSTHGSGQLATASPPMIAGALRVTGSEATATIALPSSGPLRVATSNASVEIDRVRINVIEAPTGDIAYTPEYSNETFEVQNAQFSFTPQEYAHAYVHSYTNSEFVGHATSWAVSTDTAPVAYQYKMNVSLPFFFRDLPPLDSILLPAQTSPDGTIQVGPDTLLFFAEGGLDIATAEGLRHEELGTTQERSNQAGIGAAPLRVDNYAFAKIIVSDTTAPLPVHDAHLGASAIAFDGDATFSRVSGNINTAAFEYPLSDGGVTLRGRGSIDFPPAVEGVRTYHVEGDFDAIKFDDGRSIIDTTTRAVTIVTALAVVLFALTRIGRELIGTGLASLYTRIKPSRVLDNQERQRLYDLIASQPGLHLRELQRTLDWGWGSLHYHLGVLRKNGLITIEKRGKHKAVYQRTDSSRRETSIIDGRGVAPAIYNAIAASPLSQADLQEALGLSRQLVAHHLDRMVEDRLLTMITGRPKRYAHAMRTTLDGRTPIAAPSS